MRTIDADALISELNDSHFPGAPYVDAGISIAIGKVCDAPTIEPERKKGIGSEGKQMAKETVEYLNCVFDPKRQPLVDAYFNEAVKEIEKPRAKEIALKVLDAVFSFPVIMFVAYMIMFILY